LFFEIPLPVFPFLHLSLIDSYSFPAPSNFLNALINPLVEFIGIPNDIIHLFPTAVEFSAKSFIILNHLLDIIVLVASFSFQPLDLPKDIVDVMFDIIVESSFLLNLFFGVVEFLLVFGHFRPVVFNLMLVALELSFFVQNLVSYILKF